MESHGNLNVKMCMNPAIDTTLPFNGKVVSEQYALSFKELFSKIWLILVFACKVMKCRSQQREGDTSLGHLSKSFHCALNLVQWNPLHEGHINIYSLSLPNICQQVSLMSGNKDQDFAT